MPLPIRRLVPALALSCILSAGATACGGSSAVKGAAAYIVAPTPSPTTPAEWQKFARARFAANAGLAAGAADRWIVKPWKEGGFKEGVRGRKAALAQAGRAGTFAYNRLRAVQRNARGDPRLAKALAPLTTGLDGLKNLPSRLRNGDESAMRSINDIIAKVKGAGSSAGARIRIRVPSAAQLASG
ncbi:hypothetical protein [Streptomyces colonosanans]|uniref:Uncharacterized protein n=1 Tax=Streptomyces colonosanans TaxID=1428652 RepID=A0A1S2NXT7_9ACTN|nr:hypothetical protein [Streptomyces colonosanans]OIJ86211.1 hypothetical protein BIV24_26930 [Streptomyces colonosanans]